MSAPVAPRAEVPFPEKQQRHVSGEAADYWKDAFINRLGRLNYPVWVARAQAVSTQIWCDYQQGRLDRSLMPYQPLVDGKQVRLLEAMRVCAES